MLPPGRHDLWEGRHGANRHTDDGSLLLCPHFGGGHRWTSAPSVAVRHGGEQGKSCQTSAVLPPPRRSKPGNDLLRVQRGIHDAPAPVGQRSVPYSQAHVRILQNGLSRVKEERKPSPYAFCLFKICTRLPMPDERFLRHGKGDFC